ncbi:MAG: RNA-directed polymerase [Candidatus Berkelbacteria bacterium]|nr:RNA-directed polymerase [Candidatus Berkelbacteria bacterium]
MANVYFNEFDRYVKHDLKIKHYLRYGDDFIFVAADFNELKRQKKLAVEFLSKNLMLQINTKNDIIVKAKQGIHFLGTEIYPNGRRLSKRNWHRALSRLSIGNYSSYWGLIQKNSDLSKRRILNWKILTLIQTHSDNKSNQAH